MKLIKVIGLISLVCFTFFYTEKIMDVSMMQDDIMIEIMDNKELLDTKPINAIIQNDTIIPGRTGKEIDADKSYKEMKKIGFYEESLIIFKDVYPEVSIYNNYNKYIISGNGYEKKVALIYIVNNERNFKTIISNLNTKITFFVDTTFLINNINIIDNNYEFYNYGNNGKYTKDNLIIGNNIINNKANNNAMFCLFTEKNIDGLNACSNSKLLSIMPSINGSYSDIKNKLKNGSIILINNTGELNNIVRYINSKGYQIVGLSEVIKE